MALTTDILWIAGRYVFLGLLFVFVLLVLRALIAELRSEARWSAAPAGAPLEVRTEAYTPRVELTAPVAAVELASPVLEEPPDTLPPVIAAPLPPRLVVVRTSDAEQLPVGRSFPLTAVTTLGRSEHNSVALRGDQFASNHHALVFMRDGVIHLRDRGSTNGTYVNGVRLEDETPLADGDRVAIGTTEFQFSA